MSTPNQPGREKEIFEQAIDLPSAVVRLGYIQGACGGDADLLARVQTLLRAHEATGGFLPDNPGGTADPTVSHAMAESPEKPGTIIGRYKLLQEIGEGGFGSVYMAAQEVPVRRRVALKVIKLGMDTKEVVARFEAERQALAMMDHPNIAKVFDAGATETGRPYFVMELVKGVPITTYCDQRQLSTQARLELFILVCQAVQHAHQKGIIHRDLKPSNILVTEQDDRPVPKVIDFGVARATQARLTEKTMFTQFHQMVGTPAYMSPEQTGLANLDIDTRSDIYSLGVLLYELLTGCTPFDSSKLLEAGYEGIMRMIREVEPPKPSTRLSSLSVQELTVLGGRRQEEPRRLGRLVQGDLDWIVMKALEKDRSRRYETATSLAQDLQRHLSNEPVSARSPSAVYRLRKLVARNKLAVSAAAVVTVALIGGLVASTLAYYNEKAAHQFAVETSHSLQKAMADARTAQLNSGEVLRQEAEKSIYAIQVMQAIVSHAATAAIIPEDRARILQLVDETVKRLRHEPHIRPATKQQLLDTAGDIYVAFDELVRAENAYRQVLSIRQIIMGAGHPETATARQKLIEVLQRQGKSFDATGLPNPAQSSSAKRSPRNSDSVPLRLAAELRLKGLYAEADAQLREAIELRKQFATANDVSYIHWQMAHLHLDAGELRGPKKLALYELEADRGRYGWFRYGFWAGINISASHGSFNAHTMLGLIALREGNRAEAVQQLLQSANGIVDNPIMMGEFKFGAPEVRLAAELLAVKETTAVLEFLERVRGPYVDALSARSRILFFSASWEDYYTNSAKSRVHAEELAGWRQEILAGNIPATWQKLLEADRPAADVPPVHLESMEPLVADLPKLHSVLLPCTLLCLGWLAVGLGTRASISRHLPLSAIKPLIALSAVRILTCILFAGTFLVEGFHPSGLIIFILTVAGWRLFWDFIQTLAPTVVTRRETVFIRALSWASVLIPVTILAVTYLSKDRWSMVVFNVGLLMTALLTLVLVLSVCAVFGWRLWKWKPEGGLRRAKWALLLSTPLVVLYAFACLSMPFFHESNPNGAVALLWADALFPWLLAASFGWRGTSQPAISSPKTPAPSH